jgi:FKBP-type peptidyl-prolyl cis-trans isomerase
VDTGIELVEEATGDGDEVRKGDVVVLDLQVSLNRGDIVIPRRETSLTYGRRDMFAGLAISIRGMREGGYRKTRVSPHLGYGKDGIPGTTPPNGVLICEIWVRSISRKSGPAV